ncbi:hypothetical protein CQW23_18977 [Capsicum baccatum]|uniref:SWIM-type domain-containing protein n=1 Tax=Capsicum baccatum TaxID=33114 RepID=A0A2G2W4I5_CAPBA|nr:hypothetical protein CQW23_18977 [Capsicum baccatum]
MGKSPLRRTLYLFYNAAKAYSPKRFSDHFEEFKNNCPEAAFFLEHELGFEKWRSTYFPGNRFDVMTLNIIESINTMLITEREYPMASIFNSIAKRFGDIFKERLFGSGYTAKVDLLERPCSCRKFELVKVPGTHAIAVLQVKHGDDYGFRVYDYSSLVYKAEEYLLAYSE